MAHLINNPAPDSYMVKAADEPELFYIIEECRKSDACKKAVLEALKTLNGIEQ